MGIFVCMKIIILTCLIVCSLFLCAQPVPGTPEFIEDFENWDGKTKEKWLMDYIQDAENAVEVIDTLIGSGLISVDFRTRNGKESLFTAFLDKRDSSGIIMLLKRDMNVNLRYFDRLSETPFHEIMLYEFDSATTTNLLMRMVLNGADPDLRDIKGYTPIHYAINEKDEVALSFFMREEVQFQTFLKDIDQRTYLDYFDQKWKKADELRASWEKRLALVPQRDPREKRKEEKAKKKGGKKAKKQEKEGQKEKKEE